MRTCFLLSFSILVLGASYLNADEKRTHQETYSVTQVCADGSESLQPLDKGKSSLFLEGNSALLTLVSAQGEMKTLQGEKIKGQIKFESFGPLIRLSLHAEGSSEDQKGKRDHSFAMAEYSSQVCKTGPLYWLFSLKR